jgi:hypothetical protein
MGVMVSERLPAVARTPSDVLKEQARYEIRPYPVCSARCGARLLITKALEAVRTKAERITLVAQLKEMLDGESELRPRPN